MRKILLIFAIFLISSIIRFLYMGTDFKSISTNAFATGGAFIHTKHGGSTTDGSLPYPYNMPADDGYGYGVDRSVNTNDYGVGGYYNNQSGEAGRYKRGECNHCHEPHASFGADEPFPNSGSDVGPDPYLLMKEYGTTTNYANLCWYCHENYNNLNNLGSPPTMGKWSFYQGKSIYQNSTHYTNPRSSTYPMRWTGTGGGGSEPWPRKSRTGLPDGNRGSCLNCHTPHGIMGNSSVAYDTTTPDTFPGGTGGVPADRQTVANNLSVNTDYLIPRQLIAWEEVLCEGCHRSGGTAPNIQDEINKRYPSPSNTARSGHPVDAVTDPSNSSVYLTGKHTVKETLPITTKHVECYDCHNPHADKASNRVEGMKYIDINGTGRDPAAGDRQPYVYEVCFKCHSSTNSTTFIPDKYASGIPAPVNAYGPHTLRTTVAQYGCNTNINPASSCTDGSNKRYEFDPNTNSYAGIGANYLTGNRAYHPVAVPGRNLSRALCNQLQFSFNLNCTTQAQAIASLGNLTINCTDCHNNQITGEGTTYLYFTGSTNLLAFSPTYPGPITQSNLRTTDVNNGYSLSPVGPHGSTNVRILRANYNTTLGNVGSPDTPPFSNWDPTRFQLCFNCHDSRAFIDIDGMVGGVRMTNFRQDPGAFGCASPKRNLHATHLTDNAGFGAWGYVTNMYTACANCHYNVHSNAEATNTMYGDGVGGALPADGNTHLVNFSPIVRPQTAYYTKPRWWAASGGVARCALACHGVGMLDGFGPWVDAWYSNYGAGGWTD